jgi:hypothetical protein
MFLIFRKNSKNNFNEIKDALTILSKDQKHDKIVINLDDEDVVKKEEIKEEINSYSLDYSINNAQEITNQVVSIDPISSSLNMDKDNHHFGTNEEDKDVEKENNVDNKISKNQKLNKYQ